MSRCRHSRLAWTVPLAFDIHSAPFVRFLFFFLYLQYCTPPARRFQQPVATCSAPTLANILHLSPMTTVQVVSCIPQVGIDERDRIAHNHNLFPYYDVTQSPSRNSTLPKSQGVSAHTSTLTPRRRHGSTMFSGWPSVVIAIIVHSRTGAMDDMAQQAMLAGRGGSVGAGECQSVGGPALHTLACLPTHLRTQPTRPRARMRTHLATCLLRVAHAGNIPLAVGMGNSYPWPRVRVRVKVTCEDHYRPALQIEAWIEP